MQPFLPTLDTKQKPETVSYKVAVRCKFTFKQKAEDNVISEPLLLSAVASVSLRLTLGLGLQLPVPASSVKAKNAHSAATSGKQNVTRSTLHSEQHKTDKKILLD